MSDLSEIQIKLNQVYYRTRPSVFKLAQLLCTENVKEISNLGKFLINSYKLRENLTSV